MGHQSSAVIAILTCIALHSSPEELNVVQLTVEFWLENALMATYSNLNLKQRLLCINNRSHYLPLDLSEYSLAYSPPLPSTLESPLVTRRWPANKWLVTRPAIMATR